MPVGEGAVAAMATPADKDDAGGEAEARDRPPPSLPGEPEDKYYHGVIAKIFWGTREGVIRSDSGRELPFTFAFVTLLGAPSHDIRYLREGMRVGFDVGWTSKGLRVTLIKLYEAS